MSKIQILIDFKNNFVNFIDELIQQFPNEKDLIIFRIFLKDQVPIEEVMKRFVEKLLPLKENVKKRDETFFINNNVLFGDSNSDKVGHFSALWQSSRLDKDDKDIIWSWVDLFIRLAEKYAAAPN